MSRVSWRFLPWMGALALVFGAVPTARAQCGSAPKGHTAAWNMSSGKARLEFVRDGDNDEGDSDHSIVGLWHTNYTATFDDNFPPGAPAKPPFPFLESFKTWHADGTEFENAFLAPGGGNICFGVWKDYGRGSVKLHHVGLMFDTSGNVSAVFTVDEIDTVSLDGQSYKGTFDFKLFDPTNVSGVGKPIAEVKGTTAAARITVN